MKKRYIVIVSLLILFLFVIIVSKDSPLPEINRYSEIPKDVIKISPSEDVYPPILHSSEFEKPIPLPVVSSAGAEDSPFIPIGRDEFYFFFAKDVREAPEIQVRSPTNGIWMSEIDSSGKMSEPKLVWLQKPGMLSLNGCEFIKDNELFFCAAREGYTGLNWFLANWDEKKGKWEFEDIVNFPKSYEVGELHIHGSELYYHSSKVGGKGGKDIWVSTENEDKTWSTPENVGVVNSVENEGYPYINSQGDELWFNRFYLGTPSVWRSKKVNGEWQTPELIVSQFAGEPTLDKKGNLYFVHHYYKDNVMLEADIYVAYKK